MDHAEKGRREWRGGRIFVGSTKRRNATPPLLLPHAVYAKSGAALDQCRNRSLSVGLSVIRIINDRKTLANGRNAYNNLLAKTFESPSLPRQLP